MNSLLDTCVISELAKPRPDPNVLRWIEQQDESRLYLSVLTLGELHKGIAKLDTGIRRRKLEQWVDTDLQARFARRILPLDGAILKVWGNLTGKAEKRGRTGPVIDSLLVATALVHQMILVTRNTQHAEGLGATLFDPWSDS